MTETGTELNIVTNNKWEALSAIAAVVAVLSAIMMGYTLMRISDAVSEVKAANISARVEKMDVSLTDSLRRIEVKSESEDDKLFDLIRSEGSRGNMREYKVGGLMKTVSVLSGRVGKLADSLGGIEIKLARIEAKLDSMTVYQAPASYAKIER